MKPIRVALVQLPWPGSRAEMMEHVDLLVEEAARRGAGLVCLPELTLSPYFPGTRDPAGMDWAEPLPGGESDIFFTSLAEKYGVMIVGSLFEKTGDGHLYDTATIHDANGALVGFTRKIHIPSGDGYHEMDFFENGNEFPVYDLGALKLATPTCYDQWFPELARAYTLNGADFIFYPTAIGSEPNAPDVDSKDAWETIMRGHAIGNGVFVGAANRVGVENGVRFYGSSFVCDPMGRVLAQAERDTTEVVVADLDPAVLDQWRHLFPLVRQRLPAAYTRLTEPVDSPLKR